MASRPRIGVFIVTYNAVTTIAKVLDRIPPEVRELVDEVYIFDDASQDETYMLARGYQEVRNWANLRVFRNDVNQGYGGNQKLGYRYAAERGFDHVVLLHGDGQYAPEVLPRMLAPLLDGSADAVFGSRMLERGAARAGGMPLYKYVGNKILTRIQNAFARTSLSEWHSGYRAYSVKALSRLPLERNTNDFHFDTEIILELIDRGFRIAEVPIPVYYGDEICHVNGMRYAKDVVKTALQHRMVRVGWRSDPRFPPPPAYARKRGPFSSHSQILAAIPFGSRVLDVGCEPAIAEAFLDRKCEVVGIGAAESPPGAGKLAAWHARDLERGLGLPDDETFDVVVLGDVIEHVRNAEALLVDVRRHLKPGGKAILSTGNIAFLPMRLSLLFGRFRYAPRGILDETHVRLYTLSTFLEAIRRAGWQIERVRAAPPPFEVFAGGPVVRAIEAMAWLAARLWKRLFAFQFIVEATPAPVSRATLAAEALPVVAKARAEDSARVAVAARDESQT